MCLSPVWRAVLLQYSSGLVSRQTANLHQLSGEHFSDSLTLKKHRKQRLTPSHTHTHKVNRFRSHNVFLFNISDPCIQFLMFEFKILMKNTCTHLVLDCTVVELGKRNERARRESFLPLITSSITLQLSGATDQRPVLK